MIQGDNRRDHILDSAKALLLSEGIKGTTMSSIARYARMGKPLLYQHFDSKDAIITGVIEREIALLKSTITRNLEHEPNAISRITKLWANAIDFYEKDDFLLHLLRGNDLGLAPYLYEKYIMEVETFVVGLLEDMVKSAVEADIFKECDSRIAAYMGYKIYQAGTYGRTETLRDFTPSQIMEKTMLIMGWGIMNQLP